MSRPPHLDNEILLAAELFARNEGWAWLPLVVLHVRVETRATVEQVHEGIIALANDDSVELARDEDELAACGVAEVELCPVDAARTPCLWIRAVE